MCSNLPKSTVDSKIDENRCNHKILDPGNGYFIQVEILYCLYLRQIFSLIYLFLRKIVYSYYHASLFV